jgi:hypothetical protein
MRHSVIAALGVAVVVGCSGERHSPPPPTSPVVSITTPELEFHGSGPLVIQVVVEGCVPDAVDLLVDGELLARIVPPFQYTWDTTLATEGRREIVARAACGSAVAASAPVPIFVDRTPPQVVDRTPAPGSATAWIRDPVVVTFSEPVDIASASAALVLRDAFGQVIPASVTASGGGTRVTLVPTASAVAGDEVSIEIQAGVRDLAGHPLVAPGAWTFSYPEFFEPTGGPLSNGDGRGFIDVPDLAVDAAGNPVVLWRSDDRLTSFLVEGRALHVTADTSYTYGHSGVGVAGDDVYVADTDWTGSGYKLRFLQVASGAMTVAGPDLTSGTTFAFQPDVTFAPDGTPIVVWVEYDAPDMPQRLHAAFLDAGAWSDRGTASLNLDPSNHAVAPSVARDGPGRPAVAFAEAGAVYLKRWDATGWTLVGPGPVGQSGAKCPALAFDGDEPYIAVVDAWNVLRVYHLVDGAWTALPGLPMRDPLLQVNDPAIAIAAPGRVVLAWTEGYSGASPWAAGPLYVSEWNGTTWIARGGALNRGDDYPAYAPALAVGPDGDVTVAWLEPAASFVENVAWDLRLARENR